MICFKTGVPFQASWQAYFLQNTLPPHWHCEEQRSPAIFLEKDQSDSLPNLAFPEARYSFLAGAGHTSGKALGKQWDSTQFWKKQSVCLQFRKFHRINMNHWFPLNKNHIIENSHSKSLDFSCQIYILSFVFFCEFQTYKSSCLLPSST